MGSEDSFAGVVRQRSDLGRAMQQVERAAAAPAAKESWTTELLQGLRELEIAFNNHIVEVQAPEGLIDRIVDEAPRLQRAAENMELEDTRIAASIKDAIELTSRGGHGDAATDIRDSAMGLLVDLARHRQQGADLLYEAYAVDIGGY